MTVADLEAGIPLRRDLVARLIAESAVSEIALIALAAIVGVLLWPSLAHSAVLGWVGAIVEAVLVRRLVRVRYAPRSRDVSEMPWALRLAIVATGAAWGVGALVLAPHIPFADLALLMIVICGLCAAATSTLVADPPSFNGFVGGFSSPTFCL